MSSRPELELETIFANVSTADVAEAIKAVLARDEESAKIIVIAEDIKILSEGEMAGDVERDRLNAIGEFDVEIRVKAGGYVRKTVSVTLQDGV